MLYYRRITYLSENVEDEIIRSVRLKYAQYNMLNRQWSKILSAFRIVTTDENASGQKHHPKIMAVIRTLFPKILGQHDGFSKFLGDLPFEQVFYRNIPLGVPGFYTRGRIIRLDDIPSVVRLERRATEGRSSRWIMRLVPVFILETHNQTNNACLPKFVQTDNAPYGIKTAITMLAKTAQIFDKEPSI